MCDGAANPAKVAARHARGRPSAMDVACQKLVDEGKPEEAAALRDEYYNTVSPHVNALNVLFE